MGNAKRPLIDSRASHAIRAFYQLRSLRRNTLKKTFPGLNFTLLLDQPNELYFMRELSLHHQVLRASVCNILPSVTEDESYSLIAGIRNASRGLKQWEKSLKRNLDIYDWETDSECHECLAWNIPKSVEASI
eukprot:1902507-Amphidinium_carterae.2